MSGDQERTAAPTASSTDAKLADPIDSACQEFEAQWGAGRRPRIESFLAGLEEPTRSAAFKELLKLDIYFRRKQGDPAAAADYLERFPEQADLLEHFFAPSDPATTIVPPAAPGSGETLTASTDFTDLQYCAQGGLGIVFRAADKTLKRDIALKFIKTVFQSDAASQERFLLEAEITGRLDHPGVVPVYGIGRTADGRSFYVMRFIDGITLREAIDGYHRTDWKGRRREQRVEMHRLLSHLAVACNAVAYAHNRGVVHRDIKPDNIMIGKFRETLVLDWGLAMSVHRDERARASGEKTLMPGAQGSSSGTGVGTVGYMSPEQTPDSGLEPSNASDVYSLGATLYKMLTGHTPIQGRAGDETWRRIRSGDFRRPRAIRPAVPKALEAVCLKSMEVLPQDRYPGALDLAADLQNWMADEPVSVYREPLVERWLRVMRRHRGWAATLAVAAGLTLAFFVIASILMASSARRDRESRLVADEARNRSLQQSSMFAARATADFIDRWWLILEKKAEDPLLRDRILAAEGKDKSSSEWRDLQAWLNATHIDIARSYRSMALLIDDRQGILVARTPRTPDVEAIIGNSYADRDYFHRPDSNEPILQPCLSTCFPSQADQLPRVALTVPIWDSARQTPIGVLGMSVVAGQIQVLESAILVDTRTDQMSERKERGLVLQHPRMSSAKGAPQRLGASWVEELRQLSESAARREGSALHPGKLYSDFLDPFGSGPSAKNVAAASPVIVEWRRDETAHSKTGLIVIVPAAEHAASEQRLAP